MCQPYIVFSARTIFGSAALTQIMLAMIENAGEIAYAHISVTRAVISSNVEAAIAARRLLTSLLVIKANLDHLYEGMRSYHNYAEFIPAGNDYSD